MLNLLYILEALRHNTMPGLLPGWTRKDIEQLNVLYILEALRHNDMPGLLPGWTRKDIEQLPIFFSTVEMLNVLYILEEGGKGYFRDSWSALFFPVKCEMANFFIVNRDFRSSREACFCQIIFRETRNKCLIRRDFHYIFVIFRQPLLRNKWYCVTVTGQLIPCCNNVVGLVFGDLWPAIIFILCFVYFDHNGGSAWTRCPRWPRSSTRTTSLHGFTKCDCVDKFFFLIFNDVLVSSTFTLPVNISLGRRRNHTRPGHENFRCSGRVWFLLLPSEMFTGSVIVLLTSTSLKIKNH